MNDDEFEKKLRALTGSLHRPDPTPAWKSDILARARREATVVPIKRGLPPRWLMLSWAAAWAAICVLHFTTPADVAPAPAAPLAGTAPDRSSPDSTPSASPQTLFAFQRRMELNLDQP